MTTRQQDSVAERERLREGGGGRVLGDDISCALVKYKQAMNRLWEMIGEDVRISVVMEGRIWIASFGARLLPAPPVPKLPWSRAKTLPAVEGPKKSAITILEEWFVDAEEVFDGAGIRIDLKNDISIFVVRSPDYTPILEEARALEAKRRGTSR